jgi:hypothetical protein
MFYFQVKAPIFSVLILPLSFFLSVFCGGYVAGHKGGIGNWVPAGLIGVCTGGLALTLIYMLFPVAPGVRELLALLLLPAFFSSTGALVAVNRGRKQQLTRNLGA